MKTLKKLYLAIAIMVMVMVCSTTHAGIFVHDNGTQLTVSWSDYSDVLYYEVVVRNLTERSRGSIEELAFESPAIISGLAYHDIYKITVKTSKGNLIGYKYITFALKQASGDCVCICPELVIPEIIVPKKIFYGLISDGWWTGITISNVGNTAQPVTLKIGTINKIVIVSSHTVTTFLLRDLVDDTTPKSYPITYETESTDIGITVLISNFTNICAQN